jgi:hypothetical protein
MVPFADLSDLWHDLVENVWPKLVVLALTSAGSFLLGRWLGGYQARRNWHKKFFFHRLNVSLNGFHEGRLQIRTLLERSLEQVFHSPVAVRKVLAAARRTTADNPLLPLARGDCWYLLNFVLNALAEHFSHGVVRRDAGEPVRAVRYAFFLTCEVLDRGRQRKVRAMVIRPEWLRDFPYPEKMPELEQPWHDARVRTLRKAAGLYRSRPEYFLEVEVCV